MCTLPIAFFLFAGFFSTPVQLIQDLLQTTTLDQPRIEITGIREGDSPVSVTISYDPATDEVSFSVGAERSILRGDQIFPWMRLFFRKKTTEKLADQAASFLAYLASLGIATHKKCLSVTAPEGDLAVSLGREKSTETDPALFLYRNTRLPYRLITRDMDVRFEEYHRSIMPLVFPGKITIIAQGKTVVYRFFRHEYR